MLQYQDNSGRSIYATIMIWWSVPKSRDVYVMIKSLISLTNSPNIGLLLLNLLLILRKVQNNIFLLLNLALQAARLIPRTIGRILFRHKFPLHGANLANFIVSHFPRIYSLIQDVGRGQIILTLAIVHHRQTLNLFDSLGNFIIF